MNVLKEAGRHPCKPTSSMRKRLQYGLQTKQTLLVLGKGWHEDHQGLADGLVTTNHRQVTPADGAVHALVPRRYWKRPKWKL